MRTAAEREPGLLRVYEARSAETTVQRLRELAVDPIRAVRLWVARNANTPPDALGLLLQDADHSVRTNALRHPRTPAAGRELGDVHAALVDPIPPPGAGVGSTMAADDADWSSVLRALDEPGRSGRAEGLYFPGKFRSCGDAESVRSAG
ncbi:hypothetical protein [Actinoplanes awajinensis]|uniref:hypothetical protein n=1 Tax=Actinoplanes awajinensis TaxID=135946 RepID=UPI000A04CC18